MQAVVNRLDRRPFRVVLDQMEIVAAVHAKTLTEHPTTFKSTRSPKEHPFTGTVSVDAERVLCGCIGRSARIQDRQIGAAPGRAAHI
jgi:hypothetical protein